MPVNVAIVGPAGSGKTTLFKALIAGRGADGVGMVDVPDERLHRLAEAVKPLKVTPAQVRVEDTPPGSRAQRVAFARQADVLVKAAAKTVGATKVSSAGGIAKLSIVGTGMLGMPGIAGRMFRALADAGINIEMISTSEIRITCLVARDQVDKGVRVLHKTFELDRD